MPPIEFPLGLTGTQNLPKTNRTLVNVFNTLNGNIISRPGIEQLRNNTNKVARGQFVWNENLYFLQSESLRRVTNTETGVSTNIGTVVGAENIVTAIGFNTAVIVVKGGAIYTLDKSDNLVDISSNDNFVPCVSVAHIDGRFVYIPADGDPAFFSDVGAAGTVQVLSFFDAEELPDKNNNVFNFKNTLYITGTDSVELFRNTGASPNPFGRISGARLTNGFIGGLIEYNETFLFIGREANQSPGIYAISSGLAPKISNEAIDRILTEVPESELSEAVTGRFKWRGYDIAYFTLARNSFAFFGGNWFEMTSIDDENILGIWRGGFVTQFNGEYFTGFRNKVGKLAELNTDYNEKIERIIDIGFQQEGNDYFSCQSIELGVSQGFNANINSTTGAELVTNGNFTSPEDWNLEPGVSIGGGSANWDGTQSSTAKINQPLVIEIGKSYSITFALTALSAGLITNVQLGGVTDTDNISTIGTHTINLTAVNTTGELTITGNSSFVGSIDNVSVKEFVVVAPTVGMSVSKNNVEFSTPYFRDLGLLGEYTNHLVWNPPGGMGTYDGFMGMRIYTTQNVDFAADLMIANFR